MTKTLYFRVVVLFIVIVLSTLAFGFYIFVKIYNGYLQEGLKREMRLTGLSVVEAYQELSFPEFQAYLNGFWVTKTYQLNMYEMSGGTVQDVPLEGSSRMDIDPAIVRGILERTTDYAGSAFPERNSQDAALTVVGIPFEKQGRAYAVLMQPDWSNKVVFSLNVPLLTLLGLLLAGILLFLVATRYLMKPLKELSQATRRIAGGDFDVRVEVRQDDEIGILASHFNRMAEALQSIESMRREFVSNVSHEIQSPLTSIRGFSQALLTGVASEADRVRYLTMIRTESERLSRLSDNLLKLASLDSGHYPLDKKHYDAAEQLRKAVIATEPLWSQKKLHVELTLHKTILHADEDQLMQVWRNLLDNAIKFTPEYGMIEIRTAVDNKRLTVTISDSGIGIPPDGLDRVFDRFYKGDRSRSRSKEGSGLGLAIALKIALLHRGTIAAANKTDGSGAVFTVTLPAESS